MPNEDYEKFLKNMRRLLEPLGEAQKRMAETIRPWVELQTELAKTMAKLQGDLQKRIDDMMRPWVEQQQMIAEAIRRLLGPFKEQKENEEEK